MNRTWKIILFSAGLLVSLAILYFLADKKGLGEFWSLDSVKHYLFSVLMTVAIILGFCLYRAVRNGTHSEASHGAQHALLGGLHGDLISAVMYADEYLKSLVVNSEEIKKFYRKYLAGIFIIAILIWTLIVPIIGLASKGFEAMGDGGFNVIATILYGLAYAIRSSLILFLGLSAFIGWTRIKPGHEGILLLNGNIIMTRIFGDGWIYVLPFTHTVELMQVESEIHISAELDGSTDAKILTACEKNAVYDMKKADSADQYEKRHKDDTFHKDRMFVTQNTVIVVFALKSVLTFFKKKVGIEEAKWILKAMVETLRLETLELKTYAMATGDGFVVRNRISVMLEPELKAYDDCFTVKNVLMPKIDYQRKIEEPVTVAAT